MAALTAVNTNIHTLDNPAQTKLASPASPTASFVSQQQPSIQRSFINLNPTIRISSSPSLSAALEPPPGVPFSDFIRKWTDTQVARWLADIKCDKHTNTFSANDIRGDVLLEMDQVTLKEMGIASIGDRLRIVNAVKALRQKCANRNSLVSPRVVINGVNGAHEGTHTRSSSNDAAQASTQDPNHSPTSSRLAVRRLESGRPAPLQLKSSSGRSDLPQLQSSEAGNNQAVRPLPQPSQAAAAASSTPTLNTPGSNHSSAGSGTRAGLPPLPPAPRGQPPLPPPGRTPPRGLLNGAVQRNGRSTPTQPDPPSYANATQSASSSQNSSSLTPATANGTWTGGYGLPSDPRPAARSPSPLQIRGNQRNAPVVLPQHARNSSLSNSITPNSTSPANKLSPRPATGNPHPYASALQPPPVQSSYNLSPIAESFIPQSGGSQSPPNAGYSVGRGPFPRPNTPSHSGTPSLDDLRRKLVKFLLPDEGQSYMINVADCAGGVEVLEKVLKKAGKGGSRSVDSDHVQTDEGGLSVDGWGVYLDWGQGDGPGEPLTEAELLSICHAPPDNPAKEHGLTLRKIGKGKRSKLAQIFGEPLLNGSPTTPTDRGNSSSSPGLNKAFSDGLSLKATKRASSISILSGLGVRDPEKALDPPSPTQAGRRSPAPAVKKPSKLRNFFGQRPPSELITTHLTEYFPFTEKKVLERTARHSMMRNSTISGKRDSVASYASPLPSRFSSSTQGSQGRRSISPTRTSFSSTRPLQVRRSSYYPPESATLVEDLPRVSLSTDDGRSVDLHMDDGESHKKTEGNSELLPPMEVNSQSFSESMESLTSSHHSSRPVSRATSVASKRTTYITQLRSKRDRSDTASLMTVDQITAEVESRRESLAIERGVDSEQWDEEDEEEDDDIENLEDTLPGEEEEYEDDDDEETMEEPEEEEETLNNEDDEPGKAVTSRGGALKWIKGALIGAGSFGKVYLGMDASSGLLMAVKQVELPTGSAPNQERKKSMLSALEREIELLQDLQHENIVQYLYSSLDEDYLNIFLEYVPGGSVTALLRNYGAFEETLVKNFVRQILQGLDYLHERDIIHRDIKGANILVDNKGGIKISDFGISKKVDDNLLTGNRMHRPSLQGSVFWMAPEVVKQSGHTRKADIWSVGCLVVEMFTGEHPWAQLTQMQAIFKIGSSAKPTIPSDISAAAQDFLERTFELNHEARPSAGELLLHPWIAPKPAKNNAIKPNVMVEVSA